MTQADPRSGRPTERQGVFVIAGLGPRGQTTYLGAGERAEMIDSLSVPGEGRRAVQGLAPRRSLSSARQPARECITSPPRRPLCSIRAHSERLRARERVAKPR